MEQQQKILTFWDHLEELRHVLFRIAVAVVFLMLVAFLFKDELFAIVLAPKNAWPEFLPQCTEWSAYLQ